MRRLFIRTFFKASRFLDYLSVPEFPRWSRSSRAICLSRSSCPTICLSRVRLFVCPEVPAKFPRDLSVPEFLSDYLSVPKFPCVCPGVPDLSVPEFLSDYLSVPCPTICLSRSSREAEFPSPRS